MKKISLKDVKKLSSTGAVFITADHTVYEADKTTHPWVRAGKVMPIVLIVGKRRCFYIFG